MESNTIFFYKEKRLQIKKVVNGKIVEEGTHEKLMKANGKYAAMYQLQASLYAKEV